MVLPMTDFFNLSKKPKHMPLLNEIPISGSDFPSTYGQSNKLMWKRKFMDWFKTRPELNAPVNIRVNDTITDVDFFKPDGTPLGPTQLKKSRDFYLKNFMTARLKSLQFDRLITGSGFGWKGYLDAKKIREACAEYMGDSWIKGIKTKELIDNMAEISMRMDEDLRKPRAFNYIASSTVQIVHGIQDIKSYVQWFGGHNIEFTPKEVIHIPLHSVDGKVDGFSPVSSLYYELTLLYAVKENMMAYMRNGGSMSKIFTLPDEISNSENHKAIVHQLQDAGIMSNRHGNLVLTGEINVQDLDTREKDMEYQNLALYIAGNVAYALNIPVGRIPFMIGKAQSKSDAGGLAESGYWSMIESDQKTIENYMNTQLFEELGFIIKFKKRYKVDDLREAQAMNQRVDAITKMQSELVKTGLKMTDKKIFSLMDLSEEEVEKAPDMMNPQEQTGLLNQSFMKDNEVNKEPGKIEQDRVKRTAAKNNPSQSNQTGF